MLVLIFLCFPQEVAAAAAAAAAQRRSEMAAEASSCNAKMMPPPAAVAVGTAGDKSGEITPWSTISGEGDNPNIAEVATAVWLDFALMMP